MLQAVKDAQKGDEQVEKGKKSGFEVDKEGNMKFLGKLCVTEGGELKQCILLEAYCSMFAMHLKSNKDVS